jgi:sulfate adenylyltransferase subunit 1
MVSSGTPPKSARIFDATMVWFDAHPLDPAHDYLVKHTSHTVPARVDGVRHLVNVATLESEPATSLAMNEIGVVRIATAKPLFFDPYQENRVTGSFILIDRKTNHTAGAGMILAEAEGSLEDAADRLVRLVRAAVPEGAHLNLPSDDAQAMEVIRGLLKGVLK